MEPSSPSLIPCEWVYKRDGRLVPFEPDKICQALFAATERLSRPDAFLARELTDSILHFLGRETTGAPPTTAQVAELVVKVVRELGQPTLAQAFADFAAQRRREGEHLPVAAALDGEFNFPLSIFNQVAAGIGRALNPLELAWQVGGAWLREFALRTVFTRDLVAAQADGLVTLTGLEAPFELAGVVLNPPRGTEGDLIEGIEAARSSAAGFVALDGPEYALAQPTATGATLAQFVRELNVGLRATRLAAVVNLNSVVPPPWADDLAEGPLFAGHRPRPESERLTACAEELLDRLLQPGQGNASRPLRIDWHLGERDFHPEAALRLAQVARRALSEPDLAFVFDRPRQPVALAEGLNRSRPAVLLTVAVHLSALLEHSPRPGSAGLPFSSQTTLLQRVGSLARLALSAALQKRTFLRRSLEGRPAVTRGFLLDRACLVVVPAGMEAFLRGLVERGLCPAGEEPGLGRLVVQQLQQVLRQDGRVYQLDTCLDNAWEKTRSVRPGVSAGDIEAPSAGALSWDWSAPLRKQFCAATGWQGGEVGTVLLPAPSLPATPPDELVDLLRHAWQHTALTRLRFIRPPGGARQLTAVWSAGD